LFDQELQRHFLMYCEDLKRTAKDAAADNKSYREAVKNGLTPPTFRHNPAGSAYEYTYHNFMEKLTGSDNVMDYVRKTESHFRTDVHGVETERDYRESTTLAAVLDQLEAGNFLDAREVLARRLKALWQKNQFPKDVKGPWKKACFYESRLTKTGDDLLSPEERSAAAKSRAADRAEKMG
jgi:hypothetical protein